MLDRNARTLEFRGCDAEGKSPRRRRANARGAVFVEYLVLVTVSLVLAAGLTTLGAHQVSAYSNARAILYSANP